MKKAIPYILLLSIILVLSFGIFDSYALDTALDTVNKTVPGEENVDYVIYLSHDNNFILYSSNSTLKSYTNGNIKTYDTEYKSFEYNDYFENFAHEVQVSEKRGLVIFRSSDTKTYIFNLKDESIDIIPFWCKAYWDEEGNILVLTKLTWDRKPMSISVETDRDIYLYLGNGKTECLIKNKYVNLSYSKGNEYHFLLYDKPRDTEGYFFQSGKPDEIIYNSETKSYRYTTYSPGGCLTESAIKNGKFGTYHGKFPIHKYGNYIFAGYKSGYGRYSTKSRIVRVVPNPIGFYQNFMYFVDKEKVYKMDMKSLKRTSIGLDDIVSASINSSFLIFRKKNEEHVYMKDLQTGTISDSSFKVESMGTIIYPLKNGYKLCDEGYIWIEKPNFTTALTFQDNCIFADGYFYYTKYDFKKNIDSLCRVNSDGTSETTLYTHKSIDDIELINNRIYFVISKADFYFEENKRQQNLYYINLGEKSAHSVLK